MKIKDFEKTANVAWSPSILNKIYLAAGTAAQQLDASFNTNASLDIISLNLSEPGMEMDVKATVSSDSRFHKIVWGANGTDGFGTIVGGCDGGVIQIYNAAKLMKNEHALTSQQNNHDGPVRAIDFNPFQTNLLATGANQSEIFIWDMNNLSKAMTPGAKIEPLESILSIQWNRQVQHILASTFASKCVVWDLRKNETIIKLTDTVSRVRWKVVAWHPEVATQLCLASEDDQAPIVQLWDLRFATSPLKTLENHQRGIFGMAWCEQDPDLLITAAKDNRILCWNPNSNQAGGEILSELAQTNQWNFDVTWCPKNPALIAAPGYDGHVSVYSLMGGKVQQIQTTNKIADSFPGVEGYVQAPMQQQVTAAVSVDLTKPPRWLKKPVGARFGFGGKLFTFEHDSKHLHAASQTGMPTPRLVNVIQVITEPELIQKSTELEQVLEYGNFIGYCKQKAETTSDQHKKYIWHFLKANFEANPRAELLNLLGYKIEDVNVKLNEYVEPETMKNNVDALADHLSNMNRIDDYQTHDDPFSEIAQHQSNEAAKKVPPYDIKTGDDTEGLIAQALLLNNVEAAVALCLKAKRFADAIIIAMTGGAELFTRTQRKYLQQTEGYVSSLISALVSEDWASVINNCDIGSWKEALVAALTHSSDEDLPLLCELMGSRLELESNGDEKLLKEAQLCYICAGSFDKLVTSWSGNGSLSTEELQELVELVTFLQKSVERQGRMVNVTGHLAELLTNYAFILASQGSLNTALNYLGNSQNEEVTQLRERLYVALGHKNAYGQFTPRSRQNTGRSSISNYAPGNQFNTGLPATMPNQSVNQWPQVPPPKPFSPVPNVPPLIPTSNNIVQPPRPGSVGLSQSGGGLPKNKYIVDPSVQSNSYGNRNYGMNTSMQSPIPAPNANNNPFMSQNSYMPQQPKTPMIPEPLPQPTMLQPTFNPQQQQSQPPQMQQYISNAIPQATPPAMEPDMHPAAMNMLPQNTAPGWNDPPAFTKHKMPPPKQEIVQQTPITHPIFGTAPNVQPQPNNGYIDPMMMQQQQQYAPMMPPQQQQQQQPPQISPQGFINTLPTVQQPLQPTQFMQPQDALPHQDINQNVSQGRVEKPAPIQKAPIPEEHIHMQTVFNELRLQCSLAANSPQTKRKIDDVSKKLENLYDLLREHKLSPNTLTSLHQMVQQVHNGDYTGGLALHTQLVSGPDFAQIAGFMPGLKVLLQCALQLQVYLR